MHIGPVLDGETLRFVERDLCLLAPEPRENGFAVLADSPITPAGVQALAEATNACWTASLARDTLDFSRAVRASCGVQIAMFPNMVTPGVRDLIDRHRDQALGWKISGAGGGGYVILVADRPIEHAVRCVVRRGIE